MRRKENRDSKKVKTLVARYNMVANVFWSVINLAPISVFCYRHFDLKLFFVFLTISFLAVFLPNLVFDSI